MGRTSFNDKGYVEKQPTPTEDDIVVTCCHCDIYKNHGRNHLGQIICPSDSRKRHVGRKGCVGAIIEGVHVDYITEDVIVLGGVKYSRPGLISDDGLSLFEAVDMRR